MMLISCMMVVGGFQVMALLQAARAYSLGLPLESAHSWGLNRAVFYAAAKRGFKGRVKREGAASASAGAPAKGRGAGAIARGRPRGESEEYRLGDEMAFKDMKKSSNGNQPIFI